jgi:F0F1-type ATP synthase membrane subunit c/vacuolar-type H+-ATPase subunit K
MFTSRKFFELGGVAASIILIAFGIGAIALGLNGRSTVRDSLKLEKISGSPDMTRDAIAAEAKKAGLTNVVLPGGDVAGKPIDTGERARWFAGYMRIHALEASGGLTYAEMPRFATADGKGTNDEAAAQKYPSGAPMSNSARDIWVTETALTTALNTSYMAEQLALFGLVVGIALLLSGIGFGVLTLGGALKRRPQPGTSAKPVPVAAV